MSSLWKKAASIFGYLVSSDSQMRAVLVTSQSAGLLVEHLNLRELRDDRMEALGSPLRTGMTERALGHHDGAFPVNGVDQRLGDGLAHELIIGRKEGQDIDRVTVERSAYPCR